MLEFFSIGEFDTLVQKVSEKITNLSQEEKTELRFDAYRSSKAVITREIIALRKLEELYFHVINSGHEDLRSSYDAIRTKVEELKRTMDHLII